MIVFRAADQIAARPIRSRQAPSVHILAAVTFRIAFAVLEIDARMRDDLLPVINIVVSKISRIQGAEGILRQEKRSPTRHAGWKGMTVVRLSISMPAFVRPADMINFRIDRRRFGTCRQHVSDQRLIPARDGRVQAPFVPSAPVPVQGRPGAGANETRPIDDIADAIDPLP